MNRIRNFVLISAAAFAVTGCEPPANTTANTANVSNTTNVSTTGPAASAPTKESLFALEQKGWEAWKNKDRAAIDEVLSDRYVGFGPAGRLDKAGVTTMLVNPNCQVNSFSFSDEQMNLVDKDVAVLTFKAAQDATCDGTKLPANVWSSAVYVREPEGWKAVFYAEHPVEEPGAPAPKPASSPAAPATSASPAAAQDALTQAVMAVETRAWEAWKNRDASAMDAVIAKDFVTVSGSGRRDRAASLREWSEPKCEGLSYTLFEPATVQLSPTAALVTYKGDQTGSCDGRPITPRVWAASVNVKEGDAWKNAYHIEVPR